MVFNWINFLESVEIKGLEDAVKLQSTFSEIDVDLTRKNKNLKEVIKKVCDTLKLSGELEAYRSGAYGITFITSEKTLKLTTASDEALMVKKIIKEQKKRKLSNIIKYESIFKLNLKGVKKNNSPLAKTRDYYVILMERIIPLDSPDCPDGVLGFYKKYLDHQFNGIFRLEALDFVVEKTLVWVKSEGEEEFSKYVYDMAQIIKDYISIGVENEDFHFGNFGINSDGKLVSFDPMGCVSGECELKKIKKIKI
jgi:hypothetical protein